MAIEIRVHPAIREIPEATWNAFLGVAEAPFLSWAWLEALEKTGCVSERAGWLAHHLSFWEEGEMIAAAPAYLKGNSEGEFVFDWAWAGAAQRAGLEYYPKLIVAVPFTPATASRLLVKRDEDRARLLPVLAQALNQLIDKLEVSGAHVLFPKEEEALALEKSGMLLRLGLQFHWKNAGYATFDDFLARFSSKRRNQIKRERKEMQKLGIELTTTSGNDLTPPLVDFAFKCYVTTVDKFHWGRRYLNRAFFEEIAPRLGPGLEVVIAREGKKLLGGAVNLAGPKTLYGRYWGAIEDRPFLHFNVCFYHSIDDCIQKGRVLFEPGAGGEHKLVRGFEPSLTWSTHELAHPGLRRAVADSLKRERAMQLENLEASESAFK